MRAELNVYSIEQKNERTEFLSTYIFFRHFLSIEQIRTAQLHILIGEQATQTSKALQTERQIL